MNIIKRMIENETKSEEVKEEIILIEFKI